MRIWLKLLALTALLMLGLPTFASAHEGPHADSVAISVDDAALSEASNALSGEFYFENAAGTVVTHCNFLCCCEGMSRCASSGACSLGAAVTGASTHVPGLRAVALLRPRDEIILPFEAVFGLERPPKA